MLTYTSSHRRSVRENESVLRHVCNLAKDRTRESRLGLLSLTWRPRQAEDSQPKPQARWLCLCASPDPLVARVSEEARATAKKRGREQRRPRRQPRALPRPPCSHPTTPRRGLFLPPPLRPLQAAAPLASRIRGRWFQVRPRSNPLPTCCCSSSCLIDVVLDIGLLLQSLHDWCG
jgi:hypothetical protein